MAIEDKLSYCNLQGPVTIGVRRPHHKTSALATPGGFGLLYYLIVKDQSHRKNSLHPSSCGAFSRCGVLPVRLAPSGLHSSTAELFTRAQLIARYFRHDVLRSGFTVSLLNSLINT